MINGVWLREYRKEKKRSQVRFAAELGISQGLLSQLENTHAPLCREMLVRLDAFRKNDGFVPQAVLDATPLRAGRKLGQKKKRLKVYTGTTTDGRAVRYTRAEDGTCRIIEFT